MKENFRFKHISYEEWYNGMQNGTITRHPDRYYIALNKDLIVKSEEYNDEDHDPYWAKENELYNSLQQRRIDCTLELIKAAKIQNAHNTKILDFACGMGLITSNIKKKYDNVVLIGLDISAKAITYNVKHFPEIDFVLADGFNAPFLDKTFDLVVCNNFWEHIENPFLLAKEINRMLKVGGHLIISTPSRYHFDNLWSVIRGKRVHFQNPKYHYTEYTIGQIKEQLERNRFQTVNIISKPVKTVHQSLKSSLKHRMIKPVIQKFLTVIKSHHILENTAFILARKVKDIT